jgi:hypothetical protein
MANFKTHITVSTTLGVGYGAVGYTLLDMPVESAVLATGLCSVAGMLPDLDADKGRPLKEGMAFLAAIAPMLMVERLTHLQLSPEVMVAVAALSYVLIRFGFTRIIQKFTVHRGMFHSLPAAVIAAELGFLACMCTDTNARLYKAGGVLLGFMSHLLIDELWSIEWKFGKVRLKRSSGTAVKIWGRTAGANLITLVLLVICTAAAYGDNSAMEWLHQRIHGHLAPLDPDLADDDHSLHDHFRQAAREVKNTVHR